MCVCVCVCVCVSVFDVGMLWINAVLVGFGVMGTTIEDSYFVSYSRGKFRGRNRYRSPVYHTDRRHLCTTRWACVTASRGSVSGSGDLCATVKHTFSSAACGIMNSYSIGLYDVIHRVMQYKNSEEKKQTCTIAYL